MYMYIRYPTIIIHIRVSCRKCCRGRDFTQTMASVHNVKRERGREGDERERGRERERGEGGEKERGGERGMYSVYAYSNTPIYMYVDYSIIS